MGLKVYTHRPMGLFGETETGVQQDNVTFLGRGDENYFCASLWSASVEIETRHYCIDGTFPGDQICLTWSHGTVLWDQNFAPLTR